MLSFCSKAMLWGLLVLLAAKTAIAQDGHPALNEPDRFAWTLFERINAPITGDTSGRVEWEGWALARLVFQNPDRAPAWETSIGHDDRRPRFEEDLVQQAVRRELLGSIPQHPGDLGPTVDPQSPRGNETRLNRAAFDFVVAQELYHVDGQEAFFLNPARRSRPNGSVVRQIEFPREAIEIKAQWRPIKEADAPRFHVARIAAGRDAGLWGLVALHITTKDVPNWFWATFEHVDNPSRQAVLPDRDLAGRPASLTGTKWENYVLRGTQVDFIEPTGTPTLLASSVIEAGFQQTSSCITCHARASIGAPPAGAGSDRLSVFAPNGDGFIGAPDPGWFTSAGGGRRYVQTDFVWALARARRRRPVPPVGPGPTANGQDEPRPRVSRGLLTLAASSKEKLAEGFQTVGAPKDLGGHTVLARNEGRTVVVEVRARPGRLEAVREDLARRGWILLTESGLVTARVGLRAFKGLLANPDIQGVYEASPRGANQPVRGVSNRDAGLMHSVDWFTKGAINGQKTRVGVWDGGAVRTSHHEFWLDPTRQPERRVFQSEQFADGEHLSSHATHVAGTIAALGLNPQARGMAPAATVLCHDWYDDVKELSSAAVAPIESRIVCSNHSYGYLRGWHVTPVLDQQGEVVSYDYSWHGNPADDPDEDSQFGKYDRVSVDFDAVVHTRNWHERELPEWRPRVRTEPGVLPIIAAGNDRDDMGPPDEREYVLALTGELSTAARRGDGENDEGYDTLEGAAVAKNVLTVGAIEDVEGDVVPARVVTTTFSSWGPTDDGRIKPDVVCNGARLFSPSAGGDEAYATMSGTSMASPVACGIAALVAHSFQDAHQRPPHADELKAILIHTALRGLEGPSYRTGWGMVRADWAGLFLTGDRPPAIFPVHSPIRGKGFLARTALEGGTVAWRGTARPNVPIRVTLVWIDPPAEANVGGLDDSRSDLVHDLDLHLVDDADKKHLPWCLDPAAPSAAAKRKQNILDNVECVDTRPNAAGIWQVVVSRSRKGSTQAFAIAISGLEEVRPAQ